MTKTIVVLGSTGSVGSQTMDVAEHLGLRVVAIAAQSSVDALEDQARWFRPQLVAAEDERSAAELRTRLRDLPVTVVSGENGVLQAATTPCDIVVNAMSGASAELPVFAAVQLGRTVALANKETLVRSGEKLMMSAKLRGATILPVDSEHSAIFQCLQAQAGNNIKRIILTASGGAFLGMTREQMKNVKPEDALKHPNWLMGPKITVDSATMMNKGLEYIEAMRMFSLTPEQIKIVVHPQSIIHSAVEFEDGAVMAQLASPDMRLPIQYALTHPERLPGLAPPLDLAKAASLTFMEPDLETFPCLALAMKVAPLGDAACTVLSDANEEAVERFLGGEIGFLDIYECVHDALAKIGAV